VTNRINGFLIFVSEAERLQQAEVGPRKITEFLKFVHESQKIAIRPTRPPPVDEFNHFIKLARPLLVEEIKNLLPRIAERAVLAERWLTPHDLLSVAGFSFVENSYTALMKWALDPDTHPASAHRRQRAWLKAVGLDENICGKTACVPAPQLGTDDGIPDLVLLFENATIVVEAKTGSAEHAVPSGEFQTVAYPEAVRRTLGLRPEQKIEVVFITPDRRKAASPTAKATTFVEFVYCIAGVFDREEMTAETQATRAAFGMLFTHFLTCATCTREPVRELVDRISEWSRLPD
jgi:hypothetical protein